MGRARPSYIAIVCNSARKVLAHYQDLGREMEKDVTVALFQGYSRDWDIEFNLGRMKEQMAKASTVGADIIIFPELFLSGCHKLISSEKVLKVAEERSGPSFQQLSKTAKESDIAVLYGYPEVDRTSGNEILYNSAQLIDSDGSSLANYHKTHLWIGEDEKVFTPGSCFEPIVECCGLRIGILICFDLEFPECSRTLALRGAQLIAIPTAVESKGAGREFMQRIPPARAMENCVYTVNVNQADGNQADGGYCGLSSCCFPNGDFAVMAGSEENLLFTIIDKKKKWGNNFLKQRRAELYGELSSK